MGRLEIFLSGVADLIDRVPDRVSRAVSIVMITLWVAMIALFVGFNLNRSVPSTYRLLNVSKVVSAGEPIVMLFDIQYDQKRECSRSTVRTFVDAQGIRYFAGDNEMGRHARTAMIRSSREDRDSMITVRTPTRMNPGPATYVAALSFVCNPFQEWWPITTNVVAPFMVTK